MRDASPAPANRLQPNVAGLGRLGHFSPVVSATYKPPGLIDRAVWALMECGLKRESGSAKYTGWTWQGLRGGYKSKGRLQTKTGGEAVTQGCGTSPAMQESDPCAPVPESPRTASHPFVMLLLRERLWGKAVALCLPCRTASRPSVMLLLGEWMRHRAVALRLPFKYPPHAHLCLNRQGSLLCGARQCPYPGF